MAKAGYSITTGPAGTAGVALVAATAKSILTLIAPATFGIDLTKIRVGFDGVTASAVPVSVEMCDNTLATNSTPGTANTNGNTSINQVYGRAITAGFTGFYNSTSEPTVLTSYDRWTLTPNGGLVIYDWPLGSTHDTPVSAGVTMRCTAPAAVNVTASMWAERC
jgi:hypothetical protein